MIPFIKRFSYLHLNNLDDLQPDETEVKGIVPSPRKEFCTVQFKLHKLILGDKRERKSRSLIPFSRAMNLVWFITLIHLLVGKTSSVNNTPCQFFRMRYGSVENSVVCQGEFLQIDSLKEALQELLNVPLNAYSPLKSVEDTLESLEIYDSSSVFAWNISILTSLKKLTTFIVENSEFFEMKALFGKFTTLKFVQFVSSNIKWIHSHAFKNNKNLSICSLANNYISHVERSMFPKPAMHLWSLDLRYVVHLLSIFNYACSKLEKK
ncbi:uncharacterized protein TNCV_3196181 [Trichonephila clavipes]|nr:uncharacterized protein TNCV_3196181 [Trichonephila clavipes]